jgi:proteasome lid subunit RPN8/RPN11
MPFRLLLPRHFLDEMVLHARQASPNECCGLLAGKIAMAADGDRVARVERRFPLINAAASPTEYDADVPGLVQADKVMRALALDLIGIYHSHPTSPPVPSRKDLERNFYGETVVHFIVSLKEEPPEIQSWWLKSDSFVEAECELIEDPDDRAPAEPSG